MTTPLEIQFVPLSTAAAAVTVVLAGEELALAPAVRAVDERIKGGLGKAARAAGFSGKARTAIEVLAPSGIDVQRLIVTGAGRAGSEHDRLRLGGYVYAQISARKTDSASLIADLSDTGETGAETFAADLALGALLRSYSFDKYKTRRNGAGKARTPKARRATASRSCASTAPIPTPPRKRSRPQGRGRRRVPRPRPRQRARQRPGPGGVRRAPARLASAGL